jgi:hypothetical protein
VKDLIKRRAGAAIMPLRFDATGIPGLFSTDGCIWLGDHRDPTDMAGLILQRWRLNGGILPAEPNPGDAAAPLAPTPHAALAPMLQRGRVGRTLQRAATAPTPHVDLTRLPAGAEHFLGRGPELAQLDAAWADGAGTAVVECIAPAGTGKTALVKRWLDGLRADDWRGAGQVFGWSFFSQDSGEHREVSEDLFLARAIERFGIDIDPADKGCALADHLCRRSEAGPTLLVLDGLEPLQVPPGAPSGAGPGSGVGAAPTAPARRASGPTTRSCAPPAARPAAMP